MPAADTAAVVTSVAALATASSVYAEQRLPGIAAGDTGEIRFRADAFDRWRLFKIDVTFDDVAGHRYTVEASFERRQRTFVHMTVREREPLKLERIPHRRARRLRWRRRQ